MDIALFIATFLVGAFVGTTTLGLILIKLMSKDDERPPLTIVTGADGKNYIVYERTTP